MKIPFNLVAIALVLGFAFVTETAYSQWSTNPAVDDAICTATGDQLYPAIVSDGSGGAIITWIDSRNGADADIYAQRINASGSVQWTTNGVAICTATGDQLYPTIASDGSGGAIISWYDLRNGTNYDIYAQRINASGTIQWTTNGVDVCSAMADQQLPTLASDGSGGAVITWEDPRNGTDYDIYALRVDQSGHPYGENPSITLAGDVANDQGSQMRILWRSSTPYASTTNTAYVDGSPDTSGQSYYVVLAEDIHGNLSSPSNEVSIELTDVNSKGDLPAAYNLTQNYPNPFNPSTVIKFDVPSSGFVSLKVYDVLGREVRILLDRRETAGRCYVTFNAGGLRSGVYFYRLQAGTYTAVRKMLLMK